ncbi:hypothetical protein QOZ80_5BG0453160 [Eleusine coracana subsp. coracana]|nr:hypothetical protein QOZ80_5BG0453160 [Eleusine coracana subsp. coracana]
MAPTTSPKGEGEGSGSGSKTRAASKRRDTPARALTPSVTTRSRAAQLDSARGKRSADRAADKEHLDEPKRARAADRSREEEEEDTGSRCTGEQEASASGVSEPADSSSHASSDVSSPLRYPYVPRVVKSHNPDGTEIYDPHIDSAVVSAYFKENKKYRVKLERQMKLTTLDPNVPLSCLSSDELLTVRESVIKTVFQAAKCVVGLSSSLDGKPLARCSGFFVEWDSKPGVGFVLTSGCVICTKYPSIHDKSGRWQYASDAQVHIHFANDTTVDGELIHYDNHYHIALFKIDVNPSSTIPSLSIDVKHGQDVFLLGRDENLYITSNYGRVEFKNPGLFDPNHHMYINCEVDKCGAGGLVIDFDGRFIGMTNPTPIAAFIPASIILRCFSLWKKFECIPRLHIGLKL